MTATTPYARYLAAERLINEGLIRAGMPERPLDELPEHQRLRMLDMEAFLGQCGHPERAYPAIHVTGTSGKGSVATAIAGGLRALGLRVGLHVSPYLQSATEKIWVDGAFVSADAFADLVDWVLPIARPWVKAETHASIHGMASVAIALEAFRRERVDVAVVEAGCGGRFDLTNRVSTVTSVVTSVGYDHVRTLGPRLEDIAWHKVGIFKPNTPAVVCLHGSPLEVARHEATSLGVPLAEIPTGGGPFPVRNARLARAAIVAAAPALGLVDAEAAVARVASAVAAARQPGRLEWVADRVPVCLDGAHNPDKIAAMIEALHAHPDGQRRPLVAIVGVIHQKDGPGVLGPVLDVADAVWTTEPRVYDKPPQSAEQLARVCASRCREVHACPDADAALEQAVARAAPDGMVLVTGSFYLVGALRDRWYPRAEVVAQRTSWPTTVGAPLSRVAAPGPEHIAC